MTGRLVGVGGDHGGAVHPKLLAHAGHEEDQADTRVVHEVAQRVEAVVAVTVRDDEGALVTDLDEAGCVAARGLVESTVSDPGDDAEGRGLDDAGLAREDDRGLLLPGRQGRLVAGTPRGVVRRT